MDDDARSQVWIRGYGLWKVLTLILIALIAFSTVGTLGK
jgi:hypothetical protein